jgi:hypothetical protein
MNTPQEQDRARTILDKARGRIVSAVFTKKDGEVRRMVARSGVTKYRKGGSLMFDPAKRGLYPCFDMQKREYRFISLATLQELRVNGEHFYFGPQAATRSEQDYVAAVASKSSEIYADYDAAVGF